MFIHLFHHPTSNICNPESIANTILEEEEEEEVELELASLVFHTSNWSE
jgi:hypothetical protein